MVIDDMTNLKDTVCISTKHKHEEQWSLMICWTLKAFYLCLEFTNMKNDGMMTYSQYVKHIDNMSNIKDTVGSLEYTHKECWS